MQEVVGIYNADGTIGGELSYAFTKLSRRGSCELCDVTHGWNPLGKRSWKAAVEQSELNLTFIHRDEALPEQLAAAGQLPSIIALSDDGWQNIMTPSDFAAFKAEPGELIAEVERRVAPLAP
jgi:hypothetical protein